MLVLSLGEQSGETVYLDIHHAEWCQRSGTPRWALSALLGDGWYEGEVLIESGDQVQVTFADEWLGCSRIGEFFERVDRERLLAAIGKALMGRGLADVSELQIPPMLFS
ncbi:hypothetical protein Pcar_1220 [Syntrophotalea carbinolica DSM 2380]|uniref:Uncharacterized protein n=1 Tax=Syntrophotalea carbinolica (strain DSM 2380 / NBRC 103641 / GraBd1) TaxID=338963 RepID=Q3A588_SYNC1|nr:hypothetical protein [Syntrophotalea carbinolica]ABA88469.1 hypothetical protein Pcar_1220 [Syntrophotalea carbinolica DSM 2380]